MTQKPALPRLLTVLSAAGALALAGCATGADGRDSPGTVTATRTLETGVAPEAETPAAPAPAPAATPTPTSPLAMPSSQELPYAPVGEEVTIAGEPATVCIHGDGWGTNIWAGNANTSCEFVVATHQVLIEGLNATEDNIRQHLRERVTVHSPVTGRDYELTCAPLDGRLVACTGGDNAAVYFY